MALTEGISVVLSKLAVIVSFYSVRETRRNNLIKSKTELIRDRLSTLEHGLNSLNSVPEVDDIGEALSNRFMAARKVVDSVSSLLRSPTREELRKELAKTNDSYVRYIGEQKGLIWKSSSETYTKEQLPSKISEFNLGVSNAIKLEIDALQDKLSSIIN